MFTVVHFSIETWYTFQLISTVRKKNYITNQGFELLNGLGALVSDEQVHCFLNKHTVNQAMGLQETLAVVRNNNGHYIGQTIAIDPHRIISTTQRVMPMKKKQPCKPSEKMLQTFFSLDSETGQPIACTIGSPGANTSNATLELLNMVEKINSRAIILADKEHFTQSLISRLDQHYDFEYLVPVITSQRIKKIEKSLHYKPLWAGYAVAETMFNFRGRKQQYRLIMQREGETVSEYRYKTFLTLSKRPAQELASEIYKKRWSIEEFFNFEGAMGFDRASTFNLNIRYGKMSLALLAQTANYQFRQNLPEPFSRWEASHLADSIFRGIDGDIKVENDTIIVTCYNAPKQYKLKDHYQNLPHKLESDGINPKIPWLFNFKLDFRFK